MAPAYGSDGSQLSLKAGPVALVQSYSLKPGESISGHEIAQIKSSRYAERQCDNGCQRKTGILPYAGPGLKGQTHSIIAGILAPIL
jgi:hypothetical protein